MSKFKGKSIMANTCPMGHFSEPSLKKIFNRCRIYTYYKNNLRRFVMLDPDFNVKYGDEDVVKLGTKQAIEDKYDIQLVREINEDS